jgi:hypothetical protein
MSNDGNRKRPALKHGGYSATAVLPGENRVAFDKLHRDLIDELNPSGALEDDIVETIARLLWRKQNLRTLTVAESAQSRWSAITATTYEPLDYLSMLDSPPKSTEEIQSLQEQVKKDLGETFRLVEVGAAATFDGLTKELDVKDRLDSLIDRCLKRLLFLRGLKSISAAPASSQRVISPPKKAA